MKSARLVEIAVDLGCRLDEIQNNICFTKPKSRLDTIRTMGTICALLLQDHLIGYSLRSSHDRWIFTADRFRLSCREAAIYVGNALIWFANVAPILKSGDEMIFSNYRPVSVLPVFSKVIERLMYNRLLKYINDNNLLYKYQFGFQRGRSTHMALIVLID